MPKLKIKVLSPLHIGSGDEFEQNFNLLYKDNYVYIFDEFKIVEFFISKNIKIPTQFEELKKVVQNNKDEIISLNNYIRKIESSCFSTFSKPLLEQISTQKNPIVSGSSIKGAIKTAYFKKLIDENKFENEIKKLEDIEDRLENAANHEKDRFKKDKNILLRQIDNKFINELKSVSKDLKISDSFISLKTKVCKTINIKKEKSHQSSRTQKIEQISNFVESIKEQQNFEVDLRISDNFFNSLVVVCNNFYKKEYEKEFSSYFLDKQRLPKIKLEKNQFLLNIGRFGGAELKSVEALRSLKRTGADVEWETSARTYAQDKNIQDKTYFENLLVPFGWLLCEIVD